jgi:NAD(P)-dependent dehydrogenase (short-subunit alcohol dehydrogenase family)
LSTLQSRQRAQYAANVRHLKNVRAIESEEPMRRLQGRRIAITGAGSGIGAAIAGRFAEEGAAVALLDRDADALEAVAQTVSGATLVVDVTQAAQVAGAIEEAARQLGGIDGVVNAAGVLQIARFEDAELSQWQRTLEVNLTGPWLTCRAALPHLRNAPAATIVNIASGLALRPAAGYSAYAASKSGLIALTRTLAIELAPSIRVNAVCPGAVDTPMTRELYLDPRRRAETAQNYALGRFATVAEVANTVLFLTSSESSCTTGVALAVDGGRAFH